MFSVRLFRRFTVKLEQRMSVHHCEMVCEMLAHRFIYVCECLPVRIHADLPFDCDVLSWAQAFEDAAFVREALKQQ